jgi:hypothetical protein
MKAFIAISAYIILIAGICGYTFKILLEQKEPIRVENKSTVIDPVQKTEDSDVTNSEEESFSTSKNIDYCSTCGTEITGVPYEAFARKYCDIRCYADDPDM